MRITTWNVNSIRARKDRALAWLDRVQPDLVCLQELKCTDDVFPREPFEAKGYQIATYGQKTYNGVGLLSRASLQDVAQVHPLPDDPAARGIAATIDGVRVIDLYVPNGKEVGSESYAYKLRWLDGLATWLRERHRPDEPLLICGDFNIAPDDRDVYDPEAWREQVLCSTPERDALRVLIDWGLTDALRHFTDAPGLYTWWDFKTFGFQRKQGLRIDHFLVTAPVLARAQGVDIDIDERRGDKKDAEKPSDHAPVSLTLGAAS